MEGKVANSPYDVRCGDCLEVMQSMQSKSIELTICSPPYVDKRTYGIKFNLRGQEWVDWCVERFVECVRVTSGLVAWVVQGKTKDYRYDATPALLMADLHRRGINLRSPAIYHRVGIPGSGGPDWLRSDMEWIICASHPGKLPWSDNTACGKPCKFGAGGEMSYRTTDGTRSNKKTGKRLLGGMAARATEPKPLAFINGELPAGAKLHTKNDGSKMRVQCYTPPEISNPGNVIHCNVGGGRMGSDLAHENEAPFALDLAAFFVKSFCPPGGIVMDPFCGSGSSGHAAVLHGRRFIGIDVRQSQADLTIRRLAEAECQVMELASCSQ